MWGSGQCFGCAGPCRDVQETAHAAHALSMWGGWYKVPPCTSINTSTCLPWRLPMHVVFSSLCYMSATCVCVEALLKSTFRNQN
jgi:hypothetical protein